MLFFEKDGCSQSLYSQHNYLVLNISSNLLCIIVYVTRPSIERIWACRHSCIIKLTDVSAAVTFIFEVIR